MFGEIKLDSSAFVSAVQRIETRLKDTTKQIGLQETAAKDLGKTTAVTARQFEKFRETLANAEIRFRLVADAYNKGEATTKQLATALKALDRVAEQVNIRLKDNHARLQDFADSGKVSLGMLSDLGNAFTGAFNLARTLSNGLSTVVNGFEAVASAGWNWINTASQMGSRVQDVIDRTGLTAETLQTLDVAAKQSGSSLQELVPSLGIFSKNIAKAGEEAERSKEFLKRFGIDPQKDIHDLDGALNKALISIEKLPPGIQRMAAAKELFGKSGINMISLLASMSGGLDKTREKFIKMGLTLSGDDVKAADAFGDSLEVLGTQAKVLSSKFALQIAPEITRAMQFATKEIEKHHTAIQQAIQRTGDIMRGFVVLSQSTATSSIASWASWAVRMMQLLDPLATAAKAIGAAAGYGLGGVANMGSKYRDSTSQYSLIGSERDQFLAAERKSNFSTLLADDADFFKKKAKELRDVSASFSELLQAMRAGTMGQESGGNSRISNGRTGATGMFQVMPGNIAAWTKEALGEALSASQFKANTAAQIEVFNHFMGKYLAKALTETAGDWQKAVRMAAAAWYGGPDNMKDFDSTKGGVGSEPSFREYTQSVLGRTMKSLKGKGVGSVGFDWAGAAGQILKATEALDPLSKVFADVADTLETVKWETIQQTIEDAKQDALDFFDKEVQRGIDQRAQEMDWEKDPRNYKPGMPTLEGGPKAFGVDMKIFNAPDEKPWEHFWDTMRDRMQQWKDSLPSLKQSIGENLIGAIEGVGNVFADAVAQWDGTFKGFFKSLWQGFRQMISQLIGELVRLLVYKALMKLLGGFIGGGGGNGVSTGNAGDMLGGGLGGVFGGGASMGGGGAAESGSTTTTSNVFHLTVNGASDPKKTAQTITQALNQMLSIQQAEAHRNR